MTQTPDPPAGWYPEGNQERWWDGTAWSDHVRPLGFEQNQQFTQPAFWTGAQPAYGQPAYGGPQTHAGPPGSQSHVVRNLLIVFAVIFLLFVGGCVATVVVVGSKVNQAVNDQTPGGPNNPLTITEGRAFEVDGFEYADGWSITQEPTTQTLSIDHLVVTNHRGKADRLDVEINLVRTANSQVVATAFCTVGGALDKIPKGATATVVCTSSDPLPDAYDKITIQDVV